MSKRRVFSSSEKIAIIKEAEIEGVIVTARKHDISKQTLYTWKERHGHSGEAGLSRGHAGPDPETKRLHEENRRLKQLVVEKELELLILREFQKKTSTQSKSA